MSATIRHDLLVEGAIEARAYQLQPRSLPQCFDAVGFAHGYGKNSNRSHGFG